MNIDLYPIIVGAALVVAGIIAFVFSAPLSRAIANQQRERFGPLGEKVAVKANPRGLMPVGIIMFVLGVTGTLLGIFR